MSTSTAVTAEAILDQWRDYDVAHHLWKLCMKREDAQGANPGHKSRQAEYEKDQTTQWTALTSMIGKCDLETAKRAFELVKGCREGARGDIERIETQHPSAPKSLQRLKDEVEAADWTLPYLQTHIDLSASVSLLKSDPVVSA